MMPRRHPGRHNPIFIKVFARFALLIAVALAVMSFDPEQLKQVMPIRHVRVEGTLRNLDLLAFDRALQSWVKAGYFSVDIRSIETTVKSFSWVDTVEVIRVWPDTLLLKVVEHRAVARWGDDRLLNQRGEPFAPENIESYAYLPMLRGPSGQEKLLLKVLWMMNDQWKNRQMRVDSLHLSKRQAWVARLNNGLEIDFGKQDPIVALDRLLSLLPQLGEERIEAIQKLDLRYPNGFSVLWKEDPSMPPESAAAGI
jgi:cell division protein FtsQ